MIFGENNNYHQKGNAHLQIDITVQKADFNNFATADVIRVITNAFAYAFQKPRLLTRGGPDLEHIKYVGQISTIRKSITIKDGDLLSCFDKINENIFDHTSLTEILINNHEIDANKGKFEDYSELELIFGFLETFKKITENRGFHITFKTADLRKIIYTTKGDAINITSNINIFIHSFTYSFC